MRRLREFGAMLALVLTFAAGGPAAEARSPFMTVGAATTQPMGHVMFCIDQPAACRADGKATGALRLAPALIVRIAEINRLVNTAIRPRSDLSQYGVEERWAYPVREGDCEDYALLKQRMLEEVGIPLSDILLTVVRKPNGEGHAVLTLRSTQGDFVLDNLDWRIRSWQETPYTYLKRQDVSDPARWTAIHDGPDVLVGAVASSGR